jgi:flavodoxin
MKTLVVYYSRSGHTKQMAREIAHKCRADLEPIREERDRSGLWGYWVSAWQSLVHEAAPILPTQRDPSQYDLVVIGTPVWDWCLAPPVRSYALRHASRFKQVAFFCTEGGSGHERVFEELTRICGKTPVATVAVTERQLPEPEHSEPLRGFVARLAAA